jgi:hypothetical protein
MATRAMPLTLRPTGLSHDTNRNDWCVYEEGEEIGRIYEIFGAATEIRWFWALALLGPARGNVATHGRASTFDDAKARLAAALKAFREWRPKDSDSESR